MRLRERAAEHGEVLGEQVDGAAVDGAPAGDHAVAGDLRSSPCRSRWSGARRTCRAPRTSPCRAAVRCARARSVCRACAGPRCAPCRRRGGPLRRRFSSLSRMSFMSPALPRPQFPAGRRIAWPGGISLPSPLVGEGGERGAIASASRVRGRVCGSWTPHPPSLGFASARAPSPTRGEGKRACRASPDAAADLACRQTCLEAPMTAPHAELHPTGPAPPPPGPGRARHGPLHRGAAQRPAQRRRALLHRRDRLPGGPVPAGHRSRPPLAVVAARARRAPTT